MHYPHPNVSHACVFFLWANLVKTFRETRRAVYQKFKTIIFQELLFFFLLGAYFVLFILTAQLVIKKMTLTTFATKFWAQKLAFKVVLTYSGHVDTGGSITHPVITPISVCGWEL
jgi:hypothetical protein